MGARVRNPIVLIVVGFALMQTAWILTVPPFRGSDEFDHAYRAAAVARGQWVATDPAPDGRGYLVAVPKSLVDAAHEQCDSLAYTGPDNCNAAGSAPGGLVYVASGAATYQPVFYWIAGTAALPFEGAAALYAMRIAAALLCLAFFGLAAWSMSKIGGPWPLVGLVLAATPVLIYSTAIAAPNGLEMTSGLALWSALLALARAPEAARDGRLLAIAVLSGAVLCTLRGLGPILFAMIVLTMVVFAGRAAVRDLWLSQARRLILSSAAILAVFSAFVWWNLGPAHLAANETGTSSSSVADGLPLLAPVAWVLQTIAAFPYRDQMGAAIVYPLVLVCVLVLMVLGLRGGKLRERLVMQGVALISLTMPLMLLPVVSVETAMLWQGRYGLPYYVGFVLIASVLASRVTATQNPWPGCFLVAAITVGELACLLKVRGAELVRGVSANDGAWFTPSAVGLVVVAVLAALSFVLAVHNSHRRLSLHDAGSERGNLVAR